MRALRAQDGFTLVELLVSCALMILVLSATLGALDVFGKTTATNQKVSDAQDQARNTLDRMAWELRNATAYQVTSSGTPSAISRALPWDIVFKTVDPTSTPSGSQNANNVMRVRYCLYTPTNTLYRQVQTWSGTSTPPSVPSDPGCPGTGWTNTGVVATSVVNGGSRRVFTYNQQDENDVSAAAPASNSDIASVRARLYVDVNPGQAPAETVLATGVFLRNQNQRPVATCTATPSANGHVFLNASASVDPEGGELTYVWTDGGTVISQTAPNFDYTPQATGNHSFAVTVKDDSNLTASASCTPDPVNVQ